MGVEGRPPNNSSLVWNGTGWEARPYGAANGFSTLDGTGKVPTDQLPTALGFSRTFVAISLQVKVALDNTWILMAHFPFDGDWAPAGATIQFVAVLQTSNVSNAARARIYNPGGNTTIGQVASISTTPEEVMTPVTFPSGLVLYEAQVSLANASPVAQASCSLARLEIY